VFYGRVEIDCFRVCSISYFDMAVGELKMKVIVTEGFIEIVTKGRHRVWEIAYKKDGKFLRYLVEKHWNDFDEETRDKVKRFFEKELDEFWSYNKS